VEPVNIRELIAIGEAMGVFQFYLPFLISFAVLFGLLQKSAIFGPPEKTKRINAIISLAIATYVMAYTPIGLTVGQILMTLLGGTFLVLITLVATFLILTVMLPFFGVEIGKAPKKVLLPLLLIAGALWVISGLPLLVPVVPIPLIPPIPLTPADLMIIAMVVFTGLIIYWMVK
jgi:hypothetical protein